MIDQLIAAGRYEDALRLLKDSNDEVHMYQKILCLYSLKRLNEARIECEILKEYAEKNYYDVIAIYVTILIEMNSIEEAKHVLEEELSMPYIPGKYENIFNETYDELLKKGHENARNINFFDTISDEDLAGQLLVSNEKEITLLLLEQLEQRNIRRFIPALKEFLLDENKERIFKTIILESLYDQNVNMEFELKDKGELIKVNPVNCTPVMELECAGKVFEIIDKEIGNKDISFSEYCEEVLMGYLGNIYPNSIEDSHISLVASAIIIYVASLMNSATDYESLLIEKYKLNEKDVEKTLAKLENMMIL